MAVSEYPHIFNLSPDELAPLLAQQNQPHYRAQQVIQWLYQMGIADPQQMTNLPIPLRAQLPEQLRFLRGRVLQHQTASDGTQKLLIEWPKNKSALSLVTSGAPQTEAVLIPSDQRRTACISSQIGCAVGCRFCASGLDGLEDNLDTGQIVEQVWHLARLPEAGRISNVVFMGMGEPLANFERVVRAIQILCAKWGLGISARRITISTVGLPAQIRRLAQVKPSVTLAISLHAPNDQLRRQIIPWAQFVRIDQIIESARFYFAHTGREITLEYILLRHENDRPEHAQQLAKIARTLRSNVNLIRYNEVRGLPYERPTDDDVHRFQAILLGAGVNAHIRASRGRDIAAACGQLRQPPNNQPQG